MAAQPLLNGAGLPNILAGPAQPLPPTGSAALTSTDLAELRALPSDTLDSLRSKLVQLVDAVQTFRAQLATTPIHSLTLTYPQLLSKLLILLSHTQALHNALSAPQFAIAARLRQELPSVRAIKEEEERWKGAGGARASRVGSIGVVVRGGEKGRRVGLSGSEAEETVIQDLIITNQTASLSALEQELLSTLPPPPNESQTPTVPSLLTHVKSLISSHDEHISRCRTALKRIRAEEDSEGWDWKARVDIEEEDALVPPAREVPLPGANGELKSMLAFMKDGSGF